MKLPRRVTVKEIISSRYRPGERPVDWNKRTAGTERIKTDTGETLDLASNGGQSTPAPGWSLLLTRTAPGSQTVEWTLYGIPHSPDTLLQ